VNKDGYKTNVTMFSGEEAAEKCSGKSVRWAEEETLNQFEMGTAGSDTSISACTVGMHEI